MTLTPEELGTLPPELRTAQEAIQLPEVQEMIRKLSAYNLGVFMPHEHDASGRFQPGSAQRMQVEAGLRISFRPIDEVLAQRHRYVPVAWIWNANLPTPSAVCSQACVKDNPDDTMHYDQHTSS